MASGSQSSDPMKETLDKLKAAGFECLSKETSIEASDYVKNNGLEKLPQFMEDKLNAWKNVPLNLGIVGPSGTGKSTFMNRMRRLKAKDPGAAKTGSNETTTEPTPYTHPDNNNIILWDLPGVGTPNFPKDEYLENIKFDRYDCFIIHSATRFTENDLFLAQQIMDKGKKFYFVRNKIDQELIDPDEEEPTTLTNDQIMKKIEIIRKETLINLGKIFDQGVLKVYLISNLIKNKDKFDFPMLLKDLLQELPETKKEILLRVVHSTNEFIIEEKKKLLSNRVPLFALASGLGGVIPVPGLSVGIDSALTYLMVKDQREVLGLTDEHLDEHAKHLEISRQELLAKLPDNPRNLLSDPIQWVKTVIQACGAIAFESLAEELAKFLLPAIGLLISGGLSAGTTYLIGQKMLDEHSGILKAILKFIEDSVNA